MSPKDTHFARYFNKIVAVRNTLWYLFNLLDEQIKVIWSQHFFLLMDCGATAGTGTDSECGDLVEPRANFSKESPINVNKVRRFFIPGIFSSQNCFFHHYMCLRKSL